MHALTRASSLRLASTSASLSRPARRSVGLTLLSRPMASAPTATPGPSDAPPAGAFSGPGSEELRAMCVGPCSRDTPLLTPAALAAHLPALPAWTVSPDGKSLTRFLVARNFDAALAFFNALAPVANAAGHHPDLELTNFRDVTVRLTTHAAGGITLADVGLAARIDAVPVECSPKWLKEQAAAGAGGGAGK